jgi:hypothetical protein
MQKADLKKGQTVYLFPLRFGFDFPYHRIEGQIREVKVLTVGRQFLTVELHGKPKRFDMTRDFVEVNDHSPNYRLYLSREDIKKEFKRKEDKKFIFDSFKWRGIFDRMSDEDVQTIVDIIRKYKH